MAQVTKDMTIGEILNINMNVAPSSLGWGCITLGCPASQGETFEKQRWFMVLMQVSLKRKSMNIWRHIRRKQRRSQTHKQSGK